MNKSILIHNEDCLTTMSKMPDCHIDMTLTPPPYDDMRHFGNYPFEFEKIADELYRVTKEGGAVVWQVGDATKDGDESGTSFRQALYFKDIGFKLFDTMIFEKNARVSTGNNRGYWQCFEYVFVLSKGRLSTVNLLMDRRNKEKSDGGSIRDKRMPDGSIRKEKRPGYGWYGRRGNIWKYDVGSWGKSSKDKIAHEHPAIFPEKFAREHILSWSNEGDLIYDPFSGSGTTAKMSKILNRKFVGSEIDKEYYEISLIRIKDKVQESRGDLIVDYCDGGSA